jgi:hypothetical protein
LGRKEKPHFLPALAGRRGFPNVYVWRRLTRKNPETLQATRILRIRYPEIIWRASGLAEKLNFKIKNPSPAFARKGFG